MYMVCGGVWGCVCVWVGGCVGVRMWGRGGMGVVLCVLVPVRVCG